MWTIIYFHAVVYIVVCGIWDFAMAKAPLSLLQGNILSVHIKMANEMALVFLSANILSI